MFKWAVADELIPPSIYHGLQAVTGLTYGRSAARETEPVKPVPDLHVAVVLPFVSPHVAAMIVLQRLSGMRAGEVVIMRPCDIDTTERSLDLRTGGPQEPVAWPAKGNRSGPGGPADSRTIPCA